MMTQMVLIMMMTTAPQFLTHFRKIMTGTAKVTLAMTMMIMMAC